MPIPQFDPYKLTPEHAQEILADPSLTEEDQLTLVELFDDMGLLGPEDDGAEAKAING